MESRPCDVCGAPMTKKPGRGRWPHYCGSDCLVAARTERRRARPHRYRSGRVAPTGVRTCPTCASDFECGPGTGRAAQARYCSLACNRRAFYRLKEQGQQKCARCAREFVGHDFRRYCSVECRDWHEPVPAGPCIDCGEPSDGRSPGPVGYLCAYHRRKRHARMNRRKNIRRRTTRVVDIFDVFDVGERDDWICHLCNEAVNPDLPGNARQGPTVDHLRPLARGGIDALSNVKLAHWICNVRRGERPVGNEIDCGRSEEAA